MSKKKTIFIAALLVLLAIIGTGTLAYFATSVVVHNVITTDGVGITLVEDFPDAVPGEDNTWELDGVMPGTSHRKAVKVRNDEAKAWIRVKVTISAPNLEPEKVTSIDFNLDEKDPEKWTQVGDWYYYNSPVEQGGETSYLFRNVSFSGPNMGNEYQNAEISIDVQAQAVQWANNGATVLEAKGWPLV